MNALKKIVLAGICLLAAGCYYDSQEFLYNAAGSGAPCDTTNITYSGKVASIINANCSACHSTTTGPLQGGDIVLDNFSGLQGQAANGKLMGDINQNPGFNGMPKSGNKLTSCEIAVIQHWIDLRTPNN